MKKLIGSLFIAFNLFIAFSGHALTVVEKGPAKITGILMKQKEDYAIGVNILSRSKFLFKIKNPEILESLDFKEGLLLVDIDFEIKKIIDSQHADVIVKKLQKSAAKSAPAYTHIGPQQ